MLGTSGFRTGVNLPWIDYGCDFGANYWQPRGGLAARGIPDHVRRLFDRLSTCRASLVRWFLLTDGRAGIRFDHHEPVGIDDALLADVAVALDAATAHGLDVMFTLFDFHWCHPSRLEQGVQLGGRARVFSDPDLRAALLENVLNPLFRAVAGHPRIAAWDVINEPEWVTGRVRPFHLWSRIRRSRMRKFIGDVTALLHEMTPQPVTVGLASTRWMSLVTDVELDFYQVHWYDAVERGQPPGAVKNEFEKPVMLGEFPTRNSRYEPSTLLQMAEGAGYFSALPWSLLASDASSAGPEAVAALFEHP